VRSVLTVRTNHSAKQFALGHRGGILTASMPAPARTASNEAVNWPGPVADEEPEGGGAVVEVHQQVAGLLGGPGPGRVAGCLEDVNVAVGDFEGEEDVDPFQGDGTVDVEEVHGQHGPVARTYRWTAAAPEVSAAALKIRRIVGAPTR
jgi:hypothetical protein